MVQVTASIT